MEGRSVMGERGGSDAEKRISRKGSIGGECDGEEVGGEAEKRVNEDKRRGGRGTA